jgi:hypothetical protein
MHVNHNIKAIVTIDVQLDSSEAIMLNQCGSLTTNLCPIKLDYSELSDQVDHLEIVLNMQIKKEQFARHKSVTNRDGIR